MNTRASILLRLAVATIALAIVAGCADYQDKAETSGGVQVFTESVQREMARTQSIRVCVGDRCAHFAVTDTRRILANLFPFPFASKDVYRPSGELLLGALLRVRVSLLSTNGSVIAAGDTHTKLYGIARATCLGQSPILAVRFKSAKTLDGVTPSVPKGPCPFGLNS